MESLFRLCEQYTLPLLRHLQRGDVSLEDKLLIQKAAVHGAAMSAPPLLYLKPSHKTKNSFSVEFRDYLRRKELPGGWWFDGQSFVEASGDRAQLRPDIDEIVQRFVDDQNVKIDKYNTMVRELCSHAEEVEGEEGWTEDR